ncbi:MAG: hypothetical protein WBG38_03225 [Nodosilinea sp.]
MTSLVTGQIVFLECRQTRLYAEVIQVLQPRLTGWIRPLALVNKGDTVLLGAAFDIAVPDFNKPAVPDMLWPLNQLQPALDTEIIPLLTALSAKSVASDPADANQAKVVNEFVRSLWADGQNTADSSD